MVVLWCSEALFVVSSGDGHIAIPTDRIPCVVSIVSVYKFERRRHWGPPPLLGNCDAVYEKGKEFVAHKIVSIGRRKLSYLFPLSTGNAFALLSPEANTPLVEESTRRRVLSIPEAITTKHGSILCRLEGDDCVYSTLRALDLRFGSPSSAFVFRFALLAVFRVVCESFVLKESLFTRRKDERHTAIDTLQFLVAKVH